MGIEVVQIITNFVGICLVSCGVYLVYYFIKRYNLEKWVQKAVHAAEILFDTPESQEEKKAWVIKFLKENVNITGVSDEQLECMVEAAVELLNVSQQGTLTEKDVLDIISKYVEEYFKNDSKTPLLEGNGESQDIPY